jgi:hypothetical protein
LKEIELYAQILPHVLGSIVDIMGGAYMIFQEVIESPLWFWKGYQMRSTKFEEYGHGIDVNLLFIFGMNRMFDILGEVGVELKTFI